MEPIVHSLTDLSDFDTSGSNYITLSLSVRREKSLFGKIIEALFTFPGKISKIAASLKVSTNSVYHAAYAYCRGLEWEVGKDTGRPPYLSQGSLNIFVDDVLLMIEEKKLPTFEDLSSLLYLHKIRENRDAKLTAEKFMLSPVTSRFSVECYPPSPAYVSKIAHSLGLTVGKCADIDPSRFLAATKSNLLYWFQHVYTEALGNSFSQRAKLNADEVSLSFDMSCKVVKRAESKRSATMSSDASPGHITLMISASAGGRYPPPFFIIGGLKTVPTEFESVESISEAKFVSNPSGWMTKDLFIQYASFFCDWVTQQRCSGYFKKDEEVLLFLDGHRSRESAEAIELFRKNKITVVIFPGQLTHVLQPIDVGINSPFRGTYRRCLRKKRLRAIDLDGSIETISAAKKRMMIVEAAIDALCGALSPFNRRSAFSCTGLEPYDPKKAIESSYIRDDTDNPVHPDGRSTTRKSISSTVLTSDAILEGLAVRTEETH